MNFSYAMSMKCNVKNDTYVKKYKKKNKIHMNYKNEYLIFHAKLVFKMYYISFLVALFQQKQQQEQRNNLSQYETN